ncbi:uncharacterized protein LOC129918238 isoform X2 [Episyrphus balteatus]|uniref:uncharacterized protein LOC129918238 isoform X2 n=1 Tax=Episyrphus balteatus TaxID=286459 RepID=UPI0024860DE1|nr:uncharacterized protein LOC129918238 isoform X2 [Episyrphus balteatus]
MERSKELLSAFIDVFRSGPCLWKSANPLTQSQNATQTQPNSQQTGQQQQMPMNVNLEIGGLVTNMQKSFLQDTSPPSSICSSMDVSLYGMNSSLITSSDFLSNGLLQSIQGDVPMSGLFFDNNEKSTDIDVGGYTLNDMIRDRKALESLSLSAEGTLIKDSNIAQIDDISLINSKTTSACSTMNNSVDSMGGAGSDTFSSRTCNIADKEKEQLESLQEKSTSSSSDQKLIFNETFPSGKEQIVPNGDDDYIGDTTFNLVDSSIMMVQPVASAANLDMKDFNDFQNETFHRPIMEETVCLKRFSIADGVNTTFDCSEPNLQCETPENNVKHGKYYEQSTPQQVNTSFTSMRHKQSFTPSIKTSEVNISPIVGLSAANRTFNETFEKPVSIATNILKERIQNETFSEPQSTVPPPRLPCNDDVTNAIETIELLENINPNETFNKCIPFSKSIPGGTPAVDTADEEAFNNLLDNLGKVELNEEQIKMQKSLDTIKKRFSTALDKSEAKETSQICSPEMVLSSFSMNSSGVGDRLLSRRSRLYDGVNITQPQKSSPSGSVNCNSFVKETEGGIVVEAEETHKKTDEQHCTELSNPNPNAPPPQDDKLPSRNSKLEKRDRDRFRTIRIFKRTENGTSELNVPCIDGENEHLPSTEEEDETPQAAERAPMERISRRDITPPVMYNNNNNNDHKTEMESNNYATFKKPKAKMSRYGGGGGFGMNGDQLNRPVIAPPTANATPITTAKDRPTEQRSLSRPRYISGLQKFSASSKAISAGDLEKAEQKNNGDAFNKTQPSVPSGAELKSPMGIKSKSFHNLSSNFGYAKNNPAPATMAAPGAGVRKSTTAGSVLTEKQGKFNTTKTTIRVNSGPGSNLKQPVSKNEKSDDSVFKTPSLVSGLRAPSAKRTGLLRPSSGYYSFSVAKGDAAATTNAADIDAGRHSPTDSMSSASSRASSNGKLFPNGGSSTQIHEPSSMPPPPPTSLQQPAVKPSTGIPKPSGLRPPSSIKRSGLPRPSSIVRR